MSQKANLQTVRKYFKNINLTTFSSFEFLKGFNFLTFFYEFFRAKRVLICNSTLNFISNKIYLSISIFFLVPK